jgi:hypothetical protein
MIEAAKGFPDRSGHRLWTVVDAREELASGIDRVIKRPF